MKFFYECLDVLLALDRNQAKTTEKKIEDTTPEKPIEDEKSQGFQGFRIKKMGQKKLSLAILEIGPDSHNFNECPEEFQGLVVFFLFSQESRIIFC